MVAERTVRSMQKERQAGLDLVRVLAILFVICLHGITMRDELGGASMSFSWGVQVFVRYLSLSAVPLFLMLSGYLQAGKRFSRAYYRGILPLYLSYFVISALCMAAQALVGLKNGGTALTLGTAFYKILDFSADGYAWYFEMYIGLFLLIPFLNLAYAGLPTRAGKRALILTLAFLTLLPETLVSFAPYYGGGSLNLRIFPDFFESLYPLAYYFLGCYIGEYRPKLRRGLRLPLVLLAAALPSALCIGFTAMRGEYAWYMMNGFATLTVALTATAVFLAVYDLPIRMPAARETLASVSRCTFEMYLLSYLWDQLLYAKLSLPLPLMAILVFLGSYLSALCLRALLRPIAAKLSLLYDKLLKIKPSGE